WSFVALDRAVWLVFSVLLSKGFLSNPYCYIRGAEVFKFHNILDSIRKGIESHRLAQ
ncbi:PREDICTED: LOC109949931, partial [Prunus dulcis]